MNRASSPADLVLLLTGLASLALVVGALGFQYLVHLPPCEMCHWQRWPHIVVAMLGLVIAPLCRKNRRGAASLVIALTAVAGLAAIYSWNMVQGLPPPILSAGIAVLTCTAVGLTLAGIGQGNFRLLAMAAIGFVLLSGFIGAYQTGMQWHLLPGPSACTVTHAYVMGSNAPPPEVRCDVMTWFFLGLALPAWNAIFSLGVVAIGAVILSRRP